MIHLASTVLAAGDTQSARALQQTLLDSAYTAPFFQSAALALDCVQKTHPDVLIIGPGLDDMGTLDLLKAVTTNPQTKDIPVFVLSDAPLDQCGDELLALGASDAVLWPANPAIIAQRLRPTVRLATMRDELAIRCAVAGHSLDDDILSAEQDALPIVMVIGDNGIADQVASSLDGKIQMSVQSDLYQAQSQIEDHRFDACVIHTAKGIEPSLDLCLQIRRNPRLFNLPVILLHEGAHPISPGQAMNMGASHVMTLPLSQQELRFNLNTLVWRQRARWAIRSALAQTLVASTSAPVVPEAYSRDFLESYLSGRVSHAQTDQRQFSIVGFSFAGVDAIRHEFGTEAESYLIAQIGQWLTLLVRAEDLVAHLGGARFCVTLPDTPTNEAEVVMNRIAGVISNTDFAVPDVYRAVNVWPYVQAFSLTQSDSAHTILETVCSMAVDASALG